MGPEAMLVIDPRQGGWIPRSVETPHQTLILIQLRWADDANTHPNRISGLLPAVNLIWSDGNNYRGHGQRPRIKETNLYQKAEVVLGLSQTADKDSG